MTKIRAPGPESQEAQFSWPPVIVISQSSIINHGTGGSKYWEAAPHFLQNCHNDPMALSSIQLITLRHRPTLIQASS